MFRKICIVLIFALFSFIIADDLSEKIKQIRATMLANLPMIDDAISKLSDAAKEPAMKFRDLLMSAEQDPMKLKAAADVLVAGLSADVKEELNVYRLKIMSTLGIVMPMA